MMLQINERNAWDIFFASVCLRNNSVRGILWKISKMKSLDANFQVKRSIQGIREQMLKEIKNELIVSSPVFKHDDFKKHTIEKMKQFERQLIKAMR